MYHAAIVFQLAGIFKFIRQPGFTGIFKFIRQPGLAGIFRILRQPGLTGIFRILRQPGLARIIRFIRQPGFFGILVFIRQRRRREYQRGGATALAIGRYGFVRRGGAGQRVRRFAG
jgi:hypothetical protein